MSVHAVGTRAGVFLEPDQDAPAEVPAVRPVLPVLQALPALSARRPVLRAGLVHGGLAHYMDQPPPLQEG